LIKGDGLQQQLAKVDVMLGLAPTAVVVGFGRATTHPTKTI